MYTHTFCLVDGIKLLVDSLEVCLLHSWPPELCQDGFKKHLLVNAGMSAGHILLYYGIPSNYYDCAFRFMFRIHQYLISCIPDGLNFGWWEHLLHCSINVRDANEPHSLLKLSNLSGPTSNVQSSASISRHSSNLREGRNTTIKRITPLYSSLSLPPSLSFSLSLSPSLSLPLPPSLPLFLSSLYPLSSYNLYIFIVFPRTIPHHNMPSMYMYTVHTCVPS